MRKIRFRAWDKFNKKMISSMSLEDIFYDGNCSYDGSNILSNDFNQYIFMQFTGLKDKNGKEIYEGDVVAYTPRYSKDPFSKKMVDSATVVKMMEINGSDDMGVDCIGYPKYFIEMSIIGNIHENPELVKG